MQKDSEFFFYIKFLTTLMLAMVLSAGYLLFFYRLTPGVENWLSCLWLAYPIYLPMVLAAYRKSSALVFLGLGAGGVFVLAGSFVFSTGDGGGASLAQIPFLLFGLAFSSVIMLLGIVMEGCGKKSEN